MSMKCIPNVPLAYTNEPIYVQCASHMAHNDGDADNDNGDDDEDEYNNINNHNNNNVLVSAQLQQIPIRVLYTSKR